MPLSEIEARQSRIPSNYRIIAFDRCPFEKVLSLARMHQMFADYKVGKLRDYSDDGLLKEIATLFDKGRVSDVKNIELYKDSHGALRADVVHYKQMQSVLTALFASKGVKMPPLPHLKRGFRKPLDRDARDFFTPGQTQIILDVFAEEFERFEFNKPTHMGVQALKPPPTQTAPSSDATDDALKPLLRPYLKAFTDGARIDSDCLRKHIERKPLYVIIMQPRTGSSWLTELAMATKMLGNPHELFGEGFVLRDTPIMNCRPPKMRGVRDINQYIDQLFDEAPGAAGIEMTYHHLKALRDLFKTAPPLQNITWFYLRRRDILEQAISLARSIHSGVWHSFQANESEVPILPPLEACIGQVEKIVANEVQTEAFMKSCNIVPSRLFYEGMQNNPLGTLQRIAWTVGVPVPQSLPASTLKRLRDDHTKSIKQALRRNETVRAVLKDRPVLVPSDLAPPA